MKGWRPLGPLAIGILAVIVGLVAAFVPLVGILAAALTVASLVWQHHATQPIEVHIGVDDWTKQPNGYLRYVIPAGVAKGRRTVAVYMDHPEGGREEVLTDTRVTDVGSVVVEAGSPADFFVRLS